MPAEQSCDVVLGLQHRSRVRDLSDFFAVLDNQFNLGACQRCIAPLYVNGKCCFQQ
jgi:hypothetical protein